MVVDGAVAEVDMEVDTEVDTTVVIIENGNSFTKVIHTNKQLIKNGDNFHHP